MEHIEARLIAVERSLRRWRLGAVLACIVAVAFVSGGAQETDTLPHERAHAARENALFGPAPARLVEGQGIVLTDQNGRRLFTVTCDAERGAVLSIGVGAGKSELLVGETDGGPTLIMRSDSRKSSVELFARDGGAGIRFRDARGVKTFSP